MIPLLHDFSDATVLVFGGGPVGARKARRFAREAAVVVVSPEFADGEFDSDDTGLEDAHTQFVRAAPTPEDIPEWLERFTPALVVAATDDEAINDAIVAAARDRGVLVNRADRAGDERGRGSVVVPATVREDPVVVSIATGGAAPALSKHLREELEESLEGAGAMATVVGKLRAELKEREVPPERRREIVTDVVNSPSLWTTLRTGDSNDRQVIEDVLVQELETRGERP